MSIIRVAARIINCPIIQNFESPSNFCLLFLKASTVDRELCCQVRETPLSRYCISIPSAGHFKNANHSSAFASSETREGCLYSPFCLFMIVCEFYYRLNPISTIPSTFVYRHTYLVRRVEDSPSFDLPRSLFIVPFPRPLEKPQS